jgi:cytochrome o ubiquinol oxidase subunit 2
MQTRGCAGRGTYFARAVALAPVIGLSGCEFAVVDPKGPIAAQEVQILVDSLAIMLAIVIPTLIAIAAFAWWFRAGNSKARYRPDFVYSGRVELVVWSIPALTVLLLAGVIWIGAHMLDPAVPIEGASEPLEVQVVSLDWKWLFLYPKQKLASVNELVVPVGAPLRLSLSSGSVMTAFFVPQWGSMIYTMNGMTSHLNLLADAPGTYMGLASHLSGDGFSDMHFTARAVTPQAFADWASSATGSPFDAETYKTLEKQGVAAPGVWPLADAKLFDDIVSQKLPPAPGPSPAPRPTGL